MTLPTAIVARTARQVLRTFALSDAAAWGRGLATEASRADPENAASIRVMQKVGMRYEGPSEFAGHPAVLYRIRAADYAGVQT